VSNFRAWIRGQLSERILSRAEDRSADRQKFCALLEALSGIDSPVPLPSVYKLATKWHIDMTQELPWAEPKILRELIELGVVQKLVPDDAVFNQNLYWLRPAFREEVKKQSPINDVLQRERRGEIYREIMASLRPAGITPISKYVSQGDFRSSPSLIGCFRHGVEGRELYFLLPQQICEVISVAHRGSVLPECGLRFYGWKDAIEEKVDLVSYLSPAEMSIANRVCRVQVHIVSRAGSGRAVQRALEPFVHAFLDSEGDSSRIGPGGYFELLVQLLRAEEIAKESRLPEIVRDRAEKILKARDLDADARESRIFALVQDQVRNTLRAGIDHDAFVRIVPCTPLAARNDWITITKPGGVGIAVVRTDARAYGISSRYQLVVREPALSEIIKHLSRTHEQTVDTIVIDCVYSFTCLQAIFVFKSLNMSERVRVQISSTAESAGRHLTPRFMEVLERKMVNLASMRHGPYGAYVVDFELPQGLMAKQELVEEVLTELNEAGVNMKFISGVSNVLTDVQATDATQNAPTGPRFGSGEVFDPNKFDYVLDPDSFHRAMRKHLFIPESDAAIIATVRNYMAQRCDEDCRVLEIGSATGGLSEKLISAGVQNLDTLDPDQKLSDYWVSHKKTFYPAAAGLHYCLTLETYASQSPKLYDILVSQGVHHHIPTSDANQFPEQDYRLLFLRQCASLLRDGGIYVLSDEFLCDYGLGDDKYRIERLDQWYRMVIATATAEGHLELADLEYGFWLNDHFQTAEYKESIECFEARLRGAGERAPFQIENITRFGITEEYGGGFGVLVLKKRSQSI
jgi:SAM-dependent methyltransferase